MPARWTTILSSPEPDLVPADRRVEPEPGQRLAHARLLVLRQRIQREVVLRRLGRLAQELVEETLGVGPLAPLMSDPIAATTSSMEIIDRV